MANLRRSETGDPRGKPSWSLDASPHLGDNNAKNSAEALELRKIPRLNRARGVNSVGALANLNQRRTRHAQE
jgi:hypothetical protein